MVTVKLSISSAKGWRRTAEYDVPAEGLAQEDLARLWEALLGQLEARMAHALGAGGPSSGADARLFTEADMQRFMDENRELFADLARQEEADKKRDAKPGSVPVIHVFQGSWWFWDETWANRVGPFRSYALAQAALDKYVATELAPAPVATTGLMQPVPEGTLAVKDTSDTVPAPLEKSPRCSRCPGPEGGCCR